MPSLWQQTSVLRAPQGGGEVGKEVAALQAEVALGVVDLTAKGQNLRGPFGGHRYYGGLMSADYFGGCFLLKLVTHNHILC